jgi:hypothetical protein
MTTTKLPHRITTHQAATMMGVDMTAIAQHIRAKRLVRGEDGLLAKKEVQALATRIVTKYPQAVALRKNPIPGKTRKRPVAEADDDAEYEAGMAVALKAATDHNKRMQELKLKEVKARISRTQQQQDREAGRLIDKQEVFKAARSTAKEITSMHNQLVHDIPALFADIETRSEVRSKVQQIVDRCQFQLFKRLEELAISPDEDDDDEV